VVVVFVHQVPEASEALQAELSVPELEEQLVVQLEVLQVLEE
jgi:hypothetical protein